MNFCKGLLPFFITFSPNTTVDQKKGIFIVEKFKVTPHALISCCLCGG